jgi:hypothetical protein
MSMKRGGSCAAAGRSEARALASRPCLAPTLGINSPAHSNGRTESGRLDMNASSVGRERVQPLTRKQATPRVTAW